jgi:hypothetical protein
MYQRVSLFLGESRENKNSNKNENSNYKLG